MWARYYGWLIRVWVLVALFFVVTVARSFQVGIEIRDPDGSIFRLRIVLSLAWFASLSLVDAGIRVERNGWTLRKVGTELRRRWPKRRLALVFSGIMAYEVVYLSYHNLKSWNALNPPRDDEMLRLDRWLFFGHSPATLLQDTLGTHVAAHVLSPIYGSFALLVPMSFVAVMVFADRIRDGYVFVTGSLWVWILGTGCYYLIPSLGPFASAPHQFDRLPHTTVTSSQSRYMADRTHFLDHPEAGDALNSVNAFASLHVAVTFFFLLMMRHYGFRRVARAMSLYVVAVIISTIYFGWHFAVDDVVGLAIAYVALVLARLMIYPRGRPPDPQSE